ncbi:MAG: bifunctional diaminohydroxyphosphoribosylaminopyrimidine deaminase/5-amino-6-(5-phosphoribosylamino)uracil reductase RibD [Lachnospiraceae bacterium]|nr:bifunctional diaminohydroxyphosphoribosylaminopyrimidine deaminase/5-amino-6-(5-phosphoribosylamino)uracil reductase RibD [Lachnospiraceae bacterium]
MEEENDIIYMRRAIELARHGMGNASPNPMVGAVIVCDGEIIGEGYHRRCGEGHAEVNAVASVKKRDLLTRSTIYVTLEPCSHYGKTPPCSKLIIDTGIPRVVVGSLDPFAKVSGRGIKMLTDAGIDVTVGVLEEECKAINPVFMTAHSKHRPYITLKWAQSCDGFIDHIRNSGNGDQPAQLSTPLTFTLSHRLRTLNDAIMVGRGTVIADNPSLTPRRWKGRSPIRVVAADPRKMPADARLLTDGNETIILDSAESKDLHAMMTELYSKGITSVLVEGGAKLLQSFIDLGLWDKARVEVSPAEIGSGVKAPALPAIPQRMLTIQGNRLFFYTNNAD